MTPYRAIEQTVRRATGQPVWLGSHAFGGGCINDSWKIEGGGARFMKTNDARHTDRFAAAAEGLFLMLFTRLGAPGRRIGRADLWLERTIRGLSRRM